jgi:hypothetical protein
MAAPEPFTLFVCGPCQQAVNGNTEHEVGHPLPTPFEGDESIESVVLGAVDCHHHAARDWHEWPQDWHDVHSEQCETTAFSHQQCRGCGDTDAGARHAVTVTLKAGA